MAIQTLNTIKNWFKTTLKPSQQQFWDTWDSFRHKLDKVPVKEVEGIDELLNAKADKSVLNDHIADINAHAPQINTDWNSESGFSQLLNKPDFKTINGESVLGDGDITIEEGGLQNLDQTLANGNTSTKEMIFESNGGATTTYNNMGVLLRGNNGTNSSLSSLGFHTVGTNGLASIENKGLITVTHFGGSTLQLENNEIKHTVIGGNSSSLQFDNSQPGHFTQTIQPKTGTIALLSDINDAEYPNLQQVLDSGNETYLDASFKRGEDEDIYENTIGAKQIEIKRSNDYTPDKNEMVSLKSDLIEIAKLNTGETTALFADGLGFGNSNSNNYSTLKLNPNTTANYSTVLMPAITEEGQTKTLATTNDFKTINGESIIGTGDINSAPTLQQVMDKGSVALLKGDCAILNSSNNGFSAFSINDKWLEINNFNEELKKTLSVALKDGELKIIRQNTSTGKFTMINLSADPLVSTEISFPNKETTGKYVLATTDDFKTINGESIVGKGDLSISNDNVLHKTGNESKEGDLNIIGNLSVSEYLGITGNIEITDLDTFPRPPETNIILDKNGDLTAKNFIGQSITSYSGEFYSKVKIGNSASNENKLEVNGTISSNGIKIGIANTESSDTIFANTPVGSQKTISGNSIQIAGATGDYFLETFRYNASDYGMQRITFTSTASAGRFFIRTLTAGAWSAWIEK